MRKTFVLLALLAFILPVQAEHVTGKVVSISHEKVTVNNQVLDQVSVTVDNCATPGTLKTVQYKPFGSIADTNASGHVFDQDIHSARAANMVKQNMPNGYGAFWLDATGKVSRTGFLGNAIDCSQANTLVNLFK